jgi:PAS domain S-box-containing protein
MPADLPPHRPHGPPPRPGISPGNPDNPGGGTPPAGLGKQGTAELPIHAHLLMFGIVFVAPPALIAGFLIGAQRVSGAELLVVAASFCAMLAAAIFYGQRLARTHRTIQSQVRALLANDLQPPQRSPVREANETMLALAHAGQHLRDRTLALRISEERFRSLVDEAPVGMFRTDAQGSYTYVNARWCGIIGSDPDQLLGDAWTDLIHSEDKERVLDAWAAAIARHTPFKQQYRCLTKDGRPIWVLCDALPESDNAADRIGYIGTLTDVTERRTAEIARAAVEDQFRLAVEAGRMGVWDMDLLAGTGQWDPYMFRIFGMDADQQPVTTDLVRRHVHPADLAGLQQAIIRVAKTRMPTRHEFRIIRPDGAIRWLVNRGNVVATKGGQVWRLAGVTFDITETKKQEEERSLLIAELSHRVKNTLAVLQAIAHRSLRANDTPEAFVDRFNGRLHALANVHSLLTATEWDGTTLHQLISQETQLAELQDPRVHLSGPHVMLKPELALALALVVHELTTNALKHGALASADGRLDIVWTVTGPPNLRRLDLGWTERGGPPVKADRKRGFGSDLIERSLGHGIGGTVSREFGAEGVTVTIGLDLAVAPAAGHAAAHAPSAN